jgi:hypothetical protein
MGCCTLGAAKYGLQGGAVEYEIEAGAKFRCQKPMVWNSFLVQIRTMWSFY